MSGLVICHSPLPSLQSTKLIKWVPLEYRPYSRAGTASRSHQPLIVRAAAAEWRLYVKKVIVKVNGHRLSRSCWLPEPRTCIFRMEVANNYTGDSLISAPLDSRGAGDFGAGGAIELVKSLSDVSAEAGLNGAAPEAARRCTCVVGGPKCTECIAMGRGTIKMQMESWSPQKTTVFGVILVAFVVWAVVFGVCLNIFKL